MPRPPKVATAPTSSRNSWHWPPLTAAERRTIETGPWFSRLSAPLQQSILESSLVRRFDDGSEIVGPSVSGNEWYGVASGVVSLSVEADPGLAVLLGHVEPGAWFNDLSLFGERQRPHDARAHGETALLAVSERDFRSLLSKHPDFAPSLLRLNALRTRQMVDEFVDLKIRPLRVRLARKVLQLASRYGMARAGETLIGLTLVQHDLAMLLGASRQRVNQQLKDFERHGMIRVEPGRLVVLSRPRLQAIAESRED